MSSEVQPMPKIESFCHYVWSYYREFKQDVNGVPFTYEEIWEAIALLSQFMGLELDSVDRERVRDLILYKRG
jgi:hypothetical protein